MSARQGARVPSLVIGVVLLLGLLAGAASLASRTALEPAQFTFVNGSEPSSLDPTQTTGVPEARLMRALFEGLCVLDPLTLAPLPGMAESWEVSPDELAYTFHLRSGSRWTNGDEVTAFDFRDGFERLLDPREAAEYAYLLFCVRGAQPFATDVDARGAPIHPFDTVAIRAFDSRTLVVELERPVPWFLFLAAYPPLSPLCKRALEEMRARFPDTWRVERLRPENLVTNGPYRLVERRVNDRIRLAKHGGYWDERNVAFETLDALAGEHLLTNLNLYLTGSAGYVNEVPSSVIPRLRGRADWKPAPYLATSFYRLNVTRAPFDDVRVRRALALAIDRRALTSKITRGGEIPLESCVPPAMFAIDGYVPPSFRHVDAATTSANAIAIAESFTRDVARARALLAEAGYGPEGRTLRTIEIHYNTQSTNKDVAEVVAHDWHVHLGVDVKLVNQEKKVALDTQRRLDYDVSRSTWIADYPDPASFLEVFSSASENNRTGWRDAHYDAVLQAALEAREPERSRLYAEAEALLLDALPIIPLYAFTTTSLVDPRLGGFHPNSLDVHFPKFWRWNAPETAVR